MEDEESSFICLDGERLGKTESQNENFKNTKMEEPAEQTPQTDYVALRRQVLTTIPIMSGCLIYGMVNGFPSAVVAQLKQTLSPILKDSSIESWLASGSLLTVPFGIVVNTLISRKFGRWQALLWTYVAYIVTWMFAFASRNTLMLITSSLLLGLASGLQTICPTVYVAEISDPRYRGILVTVTKSFNNVGILVCHFLGSHLEWQYLGVLGAGLAAGTVFLIQFIPETPYWLAMNDQTTKASEIYFWLRNNSPASVTEFDSLVQNRSKIYKTESRKLSALYTRAFLKAFLITAISVVILSMSGYFTFIYYAHRLLSQMLYGVDVDMCIVILDTVRIVSSLCAFVLIKMANRRVLFVVSNVTVIICQLAFIVCFVYRVPGVVVMGFICLHTIMGSASLIPAVNLIVSEIFPIAVREIGNGICMIFHFIISFVLIKTMPDLLINVGFEMTFGIYTSILTVCFIMLYFLVPETDNLSLTQIEQNLENKK